MLSEGTAIATIAVKDLEAAKKFYGDKLGLKQVESEDPGGVMYASGASKVLVYESSYAGTNQATTASWHVDDLEGTVNELKGKGITFEQYDFPGVTRDGDIHVMGNIKAAWFKDPDGNILALDGTSK
ncbi:MAG TPA: VOC family protein [Candidatus Saccharimonadales bacterium]|nr:VOC family protein [Candidatus Saccharimonadales bacterium]